MESRNQLKTGRNPKSHKSRKTLILEKMKKLFLLFAFVFTFVHIFSQDIIIFKNGDEIKSKILEVTIDQIKYKKWNNLEGPNYSSLKLEIFMIKFENGTKEVFNTNTNNSTSSSTNNNGSKFLGTWYAKRYDGVNNKTTLTISRAAEDFLVNFKVYERVDEYFHSADGSFKEVGRMEGNSIVINSLMKLSLINDYTLLMNSKEYHKDPKDVQTSTQTAQPTKTPEVKTDPYFLNRNESKLTTNHLGYFNKKTPSNIYESLYKENYINAQFEFYKEIFVKPNDIFISYAYYGDNIDSIKNNRICVLKEGIPLIFNLNVSGIAFYQAGDYGKSIAKYSIAIQVEDSIGNEYYTETSNREFVKTNPSNYNIDISINIKPEKMLLMPKSQDLYLNFLIKDRNEKDRYLHGFAKFKIVKQ